MPKKWLFSKYGEEPAGFGRRRCAPRDSHCRQCGKMHGKCTCDAISRWENRARKVAERAISMDGYVGCSRF